MIFQGKSVLIIEDQDFIRRVAILNLKRLGFKVLEANNGKTGFELAKSSNPNIIILDLMMPILDGFQALKLLKNEESTKKIPVIITSALTEKDKILKALEAGALDYLTKPYQIEILKRKIQTTFKKVESLEKSKKNESSPIFYKNGYLYIKSKHTIADKQLIITLINSILKFKETITNIIINSVGPNLNGICETPIIT